MQDVKFEELPRSENETAIKVGVNTDNYSRHDQSEITIYTSYYLSITQIY